MSSKLDHSMSAAVIGHQLVEQLRTSGHAVTAYVRNPGKAPASWAVSG
jgi:uncharacterized protein YbjT (DUF2867 family)